MKKDIYRLVGTRIRAERQRAGLTIEALAELADISTSFLAYVETNGRKASLRQSSGSRRRSAFSQANLLKDVAGPTRDALDAAHQFTQLVRDKSPDETATILDIVRAATRRGRKKRKTWAAAALWT